MNLVLKHKGIRLLTLVLTFVMVIGLVPASAAKKKSVTVSTAAELFTEIRKADVGTVTFKTDAEDELRFYIKKLSAKDKKNIAATKLVIDAPNASIVNKLVFKSVTITACRSYAEAANGNTITLKSADTEFIVGKTKKIKKLKVTSKSTDITIRDKAGIEELVIDKKSAKVTLTAGKKAVANVTADKSASVTIKGKKSAKITINGEDASTVTPTPTASPTPSAEPTATPTAAPSAIVTPIPVSDSGYYPVITPTPEPTAVASRTAGFEVEDGELYYVEKEFNINGKPLTVKLRGDNTDSGTRKYSYSSDGTVTITFENGNTHLLTFNSAGNETSRTVYYGGKIIRTKNTAYSQNGNILKKTVTTKGWDGSVTSIEETEYELKDPAVSISVDDAHILKKTERSATGVLKLITEYTYDPDGHLIKSTEKNNQGEVLSYCEYDAKQRVIKHYDYILDIDEFVYDDTDNKVCVTHKSTSGYVYYSDVYSFDNVNGKLYGKYSSKYSTEDEVYEYDDNGRLIKYSYKDIDGYDQGYHEYSYYADGKIKTNNYNDSEETKSYTYNDKGSCTEILTIDEDGETTNKYTIDYYPNGLRKSITIWTPKETDYYMYDEAERLYSHRTVDKNGDETFLNNIFFDDNGFVSSEITVWPWEIEEEYYDNGLLTKVITKTPDGEIESIETDYEYNEDGNLLSRKRYSYEDGLEICETDRFEYYESGNPKSTIYEVNETRVEIYFLDTGNNDVTEMFEFDKDGNCLSHLVSTYNDAGVEIKRVSTKGGSTTELYFDGTGYNNAYREVFTTDDEVKLTVLNDGSAEYDEGSFTVADADAVVSGSAISFVRSVVDFNDGEDFTGYAVYAISDTGDEILYFDSKVIEKHRETLEKYLYEVETYNYFTETKTYYVFSYDDSDYETEILYSIQYDKDGNVIPDSETGTNPFA